MPRFSTSAIILRKIDFGDYDVIINFFTPDRGKFSAIAKAAKKSTKRFSGVLELFSVLNIVCEIGRRKGLPILHEAGLTHAFSKIRSDILKTAYASYWAEIINEWMEEGERQRRLYALLLYALTELDRERLKPESLSIFFQLKFLSYAGYAPNLKECAVCRKQTENIHETRIRFNLKSGGLICSHCRSGDSSPFLLQKGTVKQLLWIERVALDKMERIQLTDQAVTEGLRLLEAFTPFHLGRKLRSLDFLHQIRKG
jgi:DNA repair protein RecO (recombination protein O)